MTKQELQQKIWEIIKKDFAVEVGFAVTDAKEERFGDYACNVAMVLARQLKRQPLEIAEELAAKLQNELGETFEKITAVAPGYLNFTLGQKYLQQLVTKINTTKANFGDLQIGEGKKICNEFISANPTGPLHLGNGRGGFFGDSLTRVLRKAGFAVVSEYYVNDAGEQVVKLGHSVLQDAEAVYGGEYIEELHAQFGAESDVKTAGKKAAAAILEKWIKPTVNDKMQIFFDKWQSEQALYDEGFVDKALALLAQKGLTYVKDDATWLKTTEFGDDKDRVLIKGDGQKTYFASDCGYLLSKIERGFDVLVETWGADHHGYIGRFQAAAQALGFEGQLKFVIVQLVKLVKDGQEVRMSKRAGNVVGIDELIAEVGHDATRFFFVAYAPGTHMNFDLGLAKERSNKNPVFYVQYAHARICSILAKVESQKSKVKSLEENLSLLTHEKELSLIRELNKFPELIAEIAASYEVHRLPQYALRLADKFHSFYDACRVLDEVAPDLSAARLSLANAARIVLAETLALIGVQAPEKM